MSADHFGVHRGGPDADIARRDFLKGSLAVAGAIGGTLAASGSGAAEPAAQAVPGKPWAAGDRMKIGINLEYVRHADKSLAYGVKTAAKIGYKYVEPCFLMGRCLLSNAGYCHVTSLDIDPKKIQDLVDETGVKISALSAHSDLLNPEWGVEYARKAVVYAKALAVPVVQITEDMHPPTWMTEDDAFGIMKIVLRAIAETCADNGVFLGVEQHGPYTGKIKRMKRILELVDSPWIRCNYDCGNTFLSGEDPYEMLEAVIDKVVHVHAKDISVKQAEAERGKVTGTAVGCACGDGVIDWHRIVRRLKQAGFKGVLSAECGTEQEAIRSLAHLTKVLNECEA
ncbi:MAG: sugar phosphate isomerase/epimerase [Planctomycetia bacterium]|nr:sugar phosphate isomerase/epimerase [Planctomycetia bacterium]